MLTKNVQQEKTENEEGEEFKMLFIQYKGRVSGKFEKSLKRMHAPCKVIFTLKKIKTVLLSLKPRVEKALKSGVVYKIKCSRCTSCYVGQTVRHLTTRFKEHLKTTALVTSRVFLLELLLSSAL